MGKKMTKAKIAEFKALNKELEMIIASGDTLSKQLSATLVANAKGPLSHVIAMGALAKTVALAVCAQQEAGINKPLEAFLTLLDTELKIATETLFNNNQ